MKATTMIAIVAWSLDRALKDAAKDKDGKGVYERSEIRLSDLDIVPKKPWRTVRVSYSYSVGESAPRRVLEYAFSRNMLNCIAILEDSGVRGSRAPGGRDYSTLEFVLHNVYNAFTLDNVTLRNALGRAVAIAVGDDGPEPVAWARSVLTSCFGGTAHLDGVSLVGATAPAADMHKAATEWLDENWGTGWGAVL